MGSGARLLILAAAMMLPAAASAQEMSREDIKRSLDEQVSIEQGQGEGGPVRAGARVSRARAVGLAPAPAGPPRPLAFRQIQFAFGSAELMASSFPTLDELANALAEAMGDPRYRGVTFPIIGYTDAKGSDDYNLALSQRRSETVVRYLVARGIPAGRLMPIGRGERELADPSQPEGAINRRVEVRAKL